MRRLSADDDWNDRVPPGPRSRLRLLAVMGAVVVGCLVAAVVVALAPGEGSERADDYDGTVVIVDPDRLSLEPTSAIPTASHRTSDTDSSTVVTDSTVDTGTTATPDPDGGGDTTGDDGRDDEDSGSGEDERTDEDSTVPEEPSDPSEPSEPSQPSDPGDPEPPTSSTANTTTTTPPDDDDDDEDDDDWCFWPFCW
ncbi:hypothetical protein [Saccharomonospora piscinae]|uniref:hypothetical protein n=1 Tax=Saccharomonospora piscinae TaxID=687388 RepID=UPI001FDA8F0C|nr:hypothetical protein [Saccharomonospora piscinae]